MHSDWKLKWMWALALLLVVAPIIACLSTSAVPASPTADVAGMQATLGYLQTHSAPNQPPPQPTTYAEATAQTSRILQSEQAPSGWQLFEYDPFDSNTHNWPVVDKDSDFAHIKSAVANGIYQFKVTMHKPMSYYAYGNLARFVDFYVSADVLVEKGGPDVWNGLLFHYRPGQPLYFFEVNGSGDYHVDYSVPDKSYERLKSGRAPNFRGGIVHLAVMGQGTQYDFYVDGQHMDQMTDTRVSGGTVGLLFDIPTANTDAVIDFDNLTLISH